MNKIELTMLLLEGKEELVEYYRNTIKVCRKINKLCKQRDKISTYEISDLEVMKGKAIKLYLELDTYRRHLNANDMFEMSFARQYNRIQDLRHDIETMIFSKKNPDGKAKPSKKEKRRLLAKNKNSRCNGMRRH